MRLTAFTRLPRRWPLPAGAVLIALALLIALAGSETARAQTPPDTTAPRLLQANVNSIKPPAPANIRGDELVLKFNESLDDRTAPASNAFSVTRIDRYGRVTNIRGTGNVQFYGSNVVVKLPDNSVRHGDTFNVAYTKPSNGGRLQDWVGNAVESFSTTRVYNYADPDTSDTTAPTVTDAEVETVKSMARALEREMAIGTTLRLAFNEHLDNVESPPPGSAFTVTVSRPGSTATRQIRGIGTVRTGQNLVSQHTGEWIRAPNQIVELDLPGRILKGETVKVAYSRPSQNRLKDLNGNEVAAFSDRSVTNNTLAPMPNYASTWPSERWEPHDRLTVIFDEDLADGDNSRPAGSAFVVTTTLLSGQVTRTGTGTAEISGHIVTVALNGQIGYPKNFTVTYTKPSSGGKLRNAAGSEVETFTYTKGRLGYSTVCSEEGKWALEYDTDYPLAPREHSDIPCDMAKPAWRINQNEYGYDDINPIYNEANPAPPVNQPVASVIYTVPDQPNHRAVSGADGNCYREERANGQWQRSISYGTADDESCRKASWNAYKRALDRPMVNPDGGSFPSGTPLAVAMLDSAAVNGKTLTLTFDQSLDATSKPAPSAFTVTSNNARRSVATDGVAISGSTVTLTLTSSVAPGATVTVRYNKPSTNPLQSDNGFAVETFTGQEVTNNTVEIVLQSAAVNEKTLTLTFSQPLDAASGPATSAFIVTVNSARRSGATDGVAISGSTVTLTLTSSVAPGATVTVRYNKPSTNPLQSDSGVPVETFAGQAVTNNTAGTVWSATLTVASGANSLVAGDGCVSWFGSCSAQLTDDSFTHLGETYQVTELVRYKVPSEVYGFKIRFDKALPGQNDWTLHVDGRLFRLADATLTENNTRATWQNHGINWTTGQQVAVSLTWKTPLLKSAAVDGTALALTFSENLDTASKPASSAFTVTVNNAQRNVASDGVAISGTKVTLTLASAVAYGETVKVGYTKPSTNPLQDTAGNDVETFADRTVTNNSPFWSATLTAGSSGEGGNGCRIGSTTLCSTALSDDDFTVGGTEYHVETLATGVGSDFLGIVDLQLDQVIPTDWTLYVDDRDGLAVSDATLSNSNKTARWGQVNWGLGTTSIASVSLKAPPATSSGASGGSGLSAPEKELLPSTTVTGVSVVSDPGADQTYGIGDTIQVRVTFNQLVVDVDTQGGTPRLKIDMDPAEWGEKWASYASGSGTSALIFTHTVVEPNISTQGIAVLENTLELNGGTIQSDGADADLAHTGLNHDANHKVDWQATSDSGGEEEGEEESGASGGSGPEGEQVAPASVTGVSVSSTPQTAATYRNGETIQVSVTFGAPVDVDTSAGTPRLKIDMDPAEWGEKWASYASGSGTATLTFTHTVVEPNISTQGIAVLADTLELNGGTIRSDGEDAGLSHTGLNHDANHKVDWRTPAPTVESVAITSDPGSDDTYALGDVITISVTFSEAVDVNTSGGAPRLKIDMDPAEWGTKQAAYHSGSGTITLVFAHTVVEPNYSTQGIAVLANSLALNGGDIESKATDADADLSHTGLAHDAGHKVDWQQ